ncbi:hypothetical protein EDD21DRAFT_356144 [Dissophora ornata]|nr:hypothetical protein EDD21DRAFT_356144 [Dissophora ornata]
MARDLNFKAVNLLVVLVLVLHRAPVIKNLPLGRWKLLCLYISFPGRLNAVALLALFTLDNIPSALLPYLPLLLFLLSVLTGCCSELRDFIVLIGLAIYLAVLRSRISSETLKTPTKNETPSSPIAHDRLALLAVVAVVLALLRNTMVFRVIWFRDHGLGDRRNEAGIPQLFEWLQYQIQYALVMVFFYRLRTIGIKTREEYGRHLLAEAQHYQASFVCSGCSVSVILLFYTYVANLLLYGWVLVFIELTLIYMDLIACGFSREALMGHFAEFQSQSFFAPQSPEKVQALP